MKQPKPMYYIYRPNVARIMKRLAKKWGAHFCYLKGIPVVDNLKEGKE